MEIRLLQSSDYAGWYTLWQKYLQFYQTSLCDSVSNETWRKVTQTKTVKGFGAFNEHGHLLGFTHIVIHPNTWNNTDSCYLEDLFVSEEARRKGVARQLIETVYQYATDNQLNRVYWLTAQDNLQAQALYNQVARKTGMIQYRRDFT
ncbi:GNAT family N-acetyltransferase [Actinobacillus vicugnae]|uniref:GNAT family N-acetyltransferase n=1 Tax=Actinobacillus vicugnae TaxID=2573093 RepID=UPI001240E9A4|nr:GNAT family N-acetyltransferase [Actinobacillus vicugnae]